MVILQAVGRRDIGDEFNYKLQSTTVPRSHQWAITQTKRGRREEDEEDRTCTPSQFTLSFTAFDKHPPTPRHRRSAYNHRHGGSQSIGTFGAAQTRRAQTAAKTTAKSAC